jgi:hypothetical protein
MEQLGTLVNDIMSEMITSGKIEQIITDNVEKAVKEAFAKMFQSWGDVGKQIENGLKDAIRIDFTGVSLRQYNLMIVEMVKGVAQQHMKNAAESYLIKELDKLLSPAPKEITVQGLLDLYLEGWREEYEGGPERATVELEKATYGGYNLKLWNGEKKRSTTYGTANNEPDLSLYVRSNKTIGIMHGAHRNFGSTNFGPDAKAYQLYAAQTVITDIDECSADELETWIFAD